MAIPLLYPCFKHWDNQAIWVYSDPHFGDEDMDVLVPNRPSREEMIERINLKVGRKDTIIFLGDIGDIECIRKIRGYKVLITGNHDAGKTSYERKSRKEFFNHGESYAEVLEIVNRNFPGWKKDISKYFECNNGEEKECWMVDLDNQLFDEVYDGPVIIGDRVILSHEPLANIPWALNIHGHIHNPDIQNDNNHINCCSDVVDYTPLSFNKIVKGGAISKIEPIHRTTIDKATERKNIRGGKF